MAIIRFQHLENPFERLFNLQQELDRYFDRELFSYPTTFGRGLYPAFNLFEKGSSYVMTMELPGFGEGDIAVEVVEKQVVISGKRSFQPEEKGVIYHRRERQAGEFSRSISLPDKVDPEKVTASLKNGILTLQVEKAKEMQPRQITIKAE